MQCYVKIFSAWMLRGSCSRTHKICQHWYFRKCCPNTLFSQGKKNKLKSSAYIEMQSDTKEMSCVAATSSPPSLYLNCMPSVKILIMCIHWTSNNQSAFLARALNHTQRHHKMLCMIKRGNQLSKHETRVAGKNSPGGKNLRQTRTSGGQPAALTGWGKNKIKRRQTQIA